MGSLPRRTVAIFKAGFLGFLIIVLGAGIWSVLVAVNLSVSPAVPWAVPAMALVLWAMWMYLGGTGWPQSSSQARRLLLRANPVPAPVFGWAIVAGCLSVVALAGLWIVLTQLVKMPGNALPDFSKYPLFTVVSMILMGSVAAPLTEEPAFRGYCQVILERQFSGPVAVVISSALFSLAHGPTQGFLWPKLLFYFLVGIVFGSTAYLTNSTLPAIPGHVFGLLVFFTLVWPHDAARHLVWQSGADIWFWLHASQALLFTALTVWALQHLSKASNRDTALKTSANRLPHAAVSL
jgi:membrane protease YdiL (CAAX protease family)